VFERRLIRLPAHSERPYDSGEWDGDLVIVVCGTVDLEQLSGRRWRFEKGAIFWLQELPLRALHNPTDATAILMAVSRPMSLGAQARPS
jgi:hypothetical protein